MFFRIFSIIAISANVHGAEGAIKNNISIFTTQECLPHNKIITPKQQRNTLQCKTNNVLFEEYKEYVISLNKSNKGNIEISKEDIAKHPLNIVVKLEKELETVDTKDTQRKLAEMKINALNIIHNNIKLYPIEYDTKEGVTAKTTLKQLSQQEMKTLFDELKTNFQTYKQLKLRHNTNKVYTHLIELQKNLLTNKNINIEKIPDYQSLKNKLWEKYRIKYNQYIIKKNTFNIHKKDMINDRRLIFKEYDSNFRKYMRLSKKTNDPENKEYLEAKYKTDILGKFINKIKLYPIPRVNIRSAKAQSRINATLSRGFSYRELAYYMNREQQIMKKHKKYRNQFGMEVHYFRWVIYDHIIRNRLFNK